jgi:hypothetical protein
MSMTKTKLTFMHLWIHLAIILGASTLISVVAIMSYIAMNPAPKSLASFSSYDECVKGGGVTAHTTINACVGANEQLFLQYSAQNLPRIEARKNTTVPNHVVAEGNYSADLLRFLQQDYTGCSPTGYYKLLKEVPNRFALMQYGCDNYSEAEKGSATIIAMKLGDGWALLSPTNNMRGNMPSCLLADMFKISKQLADTCFESTGYNDGKTREVTYP